MRTTDPAHIRHVRQGSYPFRCHPAIFTDEEYALITRWGHWYEALGTGAIAPISPEQVAFVAAVQGQTPPDEPHALAWWKYRKRLAIEAEHGQALHSTHHIASDTFHDRTMAKQLRKTMGSVVRREHRRG